MVCAPSEDSDQLWHPPSLIRVFTVRMKTLRSAWASAQSDQSLHCPDEESFGPELPIERTEKTLIRLGGCPGWSESSLGAQPFCWFCHEAAQMFVFVSHLMFWAGCRIRLYRFLILLYKSTVSLIFPIIQHWDHRSRIKSTVDRCVSGWSK